MDININVLEASLKEKQNVVKTLNELIIELGTCGIHLADDECMDNVIKEFYLTSRGQIFFRVRDLSMYDEMEDK